MFQERIENYWKVLKQHKEEYCQNPLASKLLKIQAENEEIEKRIRATEELKHAKEKKIQTSAGKFNITSKFCSGTDIDLMFTCFLQVTVTTGNIYTVLY